jgi:hypothetical protein
MLRADDQPISVYFHLVLIGISIAGGAMATHLKLKNVFVLPCIG